jgi:hypothetical protein
MWDYRLFKAHYIIQDWYRDGIPIWWDESERVTFDAVARISKSRAAIDRAQNSSSSNNKKPVHGRYYVATPKVMDGGEMPTREEWLLEQDKKSNQNKPSKFDGAHGGNIVQGRK